MHPDTLESAGRKAATMTLDHPVDTSAADLLRSAREVAWGQDESAAADAYDCAIRAIEQAFRQIATPDNPTTDLGVILAHWQDRPDLWCEGYSRVHILEPTMAALDSLWKQRPQADDRLPVTLDDARVAVTIAEAVASLAEQGQIELLDELTPEEEAEDLRIAEETQAEYERHGGRFPDAVPWEEVRERLDARRRGE